MTRIFKREGEKEGGKEERKEKRVREKRKATFKKCPPHFSYHLRSIPLSLFKEMRKFLRLKGPVTFRV